MDRLPSIEEIKRRHEELYKQVLDSSIKDSLREKVDNLLEDVKTLSAKVTLLDDYRWLSDVVNKWQVVYLSIFNIPKIIKLSGPTKSLIPPIPPSNVALSEEYIEGWLHRQAYFNAFFHIREFGRQSTDEEIKKDFREAEVLLAFLILDGEINLPKSITSKSYKRLENVWVKEVKCQMAYFNWLNRGGGVAPLHEKDDYYAACDHIRRLLTNKGMKARIEEFIEVKAYLENRYLTDGRFDPNTKEGRKLIERKVKRIAERCDMGTDINRSEATTYVTKFYENIIPAVLKDDKEKVLEVLQAFKFSKNRDIPYQIINCFEVALAIYFLNGETIQNCWKTSSITPLTTI